MLKRDISWTTINFLPTLTITDFTLDSDFLLNLAVERAGWRKWLRLVLLQFIFIVKPQRQECQHPIFCSSQCSFVTSNKIAKEYFISTLLEMYFCFCFLFPPFLPPSLPPPSLPSLLTSLFLFFSEYSRGGKFSVFIILEFTAAFGKVDHSHFLVTLFRWPSDDCNLLFF